MKIRVTVNNQPDIFENGKWVKSYTVTTDSSYTQYRTRAYCVWLSMSGRKNGSVNNFESFDEFARWCQTQYGYMMRDHSGKFWSIDKDLISEGNREYSKDKCLFVPVDVNSLLNTRPSVVRELPLGVMYETEKRNRWLFKSACKGIRPETKRFVDKYEAHWWWLSCKLELIESYIEEFSDHKLLSNALVRVRDRFKYHLFNRIEMHKGAC